MTKKITLAVALGICLALFLGLAIPKKKTENINPVDVNTQIQTVSQSNANTFKTYNDTLFSIEYPESLKVSPDYIFCDLPTTCKEQRFIVFMDSHSSLINRIDIAEGMDIKKLLPNGKEITIGSNVLTIDNNTSEDQVFWVQGKGYALKITFMKFKNDPNYNNYVALKSLILK